MKKLILALCLGSAMLIQAAPVVDPVEIIVQMEKKNFPNAKSDMKLVFEVGTRKSVYTFTSYAMENNQKIIVRFSSPSDMIGHDLLMIDRNVWLYDPRSDRVMKIPSSQSFGDTGFSYGDILRLNYSDNYTPTILSDTDEGWTIELKAKERDSPYFKVVLLVSHDYCPVYGKCYTSNGDLIKEMLYSNLGNAGTGAKPLVITVKTPLDTETVNILTILKETAKSYPDNVFNKRNLALKLEKQY